MRDRAHRPVRRLGLAVAAATLLGPLAFSPAARAAAGAAPALTANPQGDTISDGGATGKMMEIQSATRTTDPATLAITITSYTALPTLAAGTLAEYVVTIDTTLGGQSDYTIDILLSGPGVVAAEAAIGPNSPHATPVSLTTPTPTQVKVTLPRSLIGGSTTFDWAVYAVYSTDAGASATDIAPDTPTVAPPIGFRRIAGPTRIATAVDASFFHDNTASAAVIARSDAYPDALAGTPLAAAKGGPLLLTAPATLDDQVKAELLRVLPATSTVYLLGGLSALSQAVADQVTALGYTVVRFAGTDRYDTALQVATKGLADPATIFLTTGADFPDALSAGAAAAAKSGALLLTNAKTMPASVSAYLAAHTGDTVFAVGGPAAAADPQASGIAGTDRYDTARKVATTFFSGLSGVGLASGANFPDALAGGTAMATLGDPLLLTDPNTLSPPTEQYLAANTTDLASSLSLYVFGGTAAISDAVITQADTAAGVA